MLACVGYGAFFLVVGLFIRNPIVPALLLYGWEWLNFLSSVGGFIMTRGRLDELAPIIGFFLPAA